MYKRAVGILTAYEQTILQNVAIDLLLKEKRMLCGKTAAKTSCCYELMKFLLLIKSERIFSTPKPAEIQSDTRVLLLYFFV